MHTRCLIINVTYSEGSIEAFRVLTFLPRLHPYTHVVIKWIPFGYNIMCITGQHVLYISYFTIVHKGSATTTCVEISSDRQISTLDVKVCY